MPGKYSHSVVLANYTTRGIISLPEDQYEKYREFVPASISKSSPPSRLGRTRSAQPIYQPPATSQEEWGTVDLSKAKQSLSANNTPVRMRGPDRDVYHRQRDDVRVLNNYRDRPAKSSPAVNTAKRAENLSAYERQQQRLFGDDLPNSHGKKPVYDHAGVVDLGRTQNLVAMPESMRLTKNNDMPERGPVHHSSDDRKMNTASSPQVLKAFVRPEVPAKSQTEATKNSNSKTLKAKELQPSRPTAVPTVNSFTEIYTHPQARLGDTSQAALDPNQIERSRSTESTVSQSTRVWDPKSEPIAEPNFDGFSDKDDGPADSFDYQKQLLFHSRDSSQNSALPIQRPDSHNGQTTASPQAAGRSYPSRKTPSESTADSSYGLKSVSSTSSTSMPNGTNKNDGLVRSPQQASVHEKNWALPEIKEDLGFSPSIFEDQTGNSRALQLDFLDLELSIGQISSGKDVNFDNDTASELSAALPPPISRFKDEEDEFNANMARMFGSGNDQAASKGSTTLGRRVSSKKSFFSKFRSKG